MYIYPLEKTSKRLGNCRRWETQFHAENTRELYRGIWIVTPLVFSAQNYHGTICMPYSILHLFPFSSSIPSYPSHTVAYVMIPRNAQFHIHLHLLLFGLPATYTARRTILFPNDNILCYWWTGEHCYSILPTTLIYYLRHWWTDVLSLIEIHFSRLPVIASFHPDIILSFSFHLHILFSRQSHNGPIAGWSRETIDPPYSLWHWSGHSPIRHPSNVTQLPTLSTQHWTPSSYSMLWNSPYFPFLFIVWSCEHYYKVQG